MPTLHVAAQQSRAAVVGFEPALGYEETETLERPGLPVGDPTVLRMRNSIMTQNIDVAATLSVTIKSSELLEFGPQRGRIADVDYHTYPARDGQPERRVLRLEFDDGRCFDLNNVTNKRFLIDAFGRQSRGWIGKLVEMWHDASIMFGTERKGGARLRIPTLTEQEGRKADIAETMPDEPPPPDDDAFA